MSKLLHNLACIALAAAPALAQPAVAPSPESTGPVRGQDWNGYNFTNSFELGYRFHQVGGDRDRYRSDVNFGNGVRLLGSSLRVNSKEGHGRLFDEIVLTTQGLGNDPYESSSLRVRHNSFYQYNFDWRLNDYVNPGLTGGTTPGHALDSRRLWQDHDLTLFPQSQFRIIAGYSRDSQDGAGLASAQLFDARGDEYPLAAEIHRTQTEYRLGGQLRLFGMRLNLLRGWQQYRERSPVRLAAPSAGANPDDENTLSSLTRSEPYEGSSPFWRASLSREKQGIYSASARFSYSIARRNFLFDEAASGGNRSGAAVNRQSLVAGSGRRPVLTGSFTVSLFPSENLSIVNQTSYHDVRMDGAGLYLEINNSIQSRQTLQFQSLGIRTLVNATDLSYRVARWIGFYGGYHYSTRRIRSVEGFASDSFSGQLGVDQDNRIHSGLAGVRLNPASPLSLSFDAEIGRASKPFYPISDRDYHAFGARLRYRTRTLILSAAARSNYNNNSTSMFVHSSRGRSYSADASWTAAGWISLDAGYSKMHLDTVSGIAYFAGGAQEAGNSLYISNVHAGNLNVRFRLGDRADLFFGYSRVEDAGDGRRSALSGSAAEGQPDAFAAAQTFPLTFDSPQARLSVRLHTKLRWNFGYQYYRYLEEFTSSRNYRAHTGFSSVIWSF